MQILHPKKNTTYAVHKNQLALFNMGNAGAEYWAHYWDVDRRSQLLSAGMTGDLDVIEEAVLKYVPRNLPVLDAGCGPARWVAALAKRGFDASGIEFDSEVVEFVNRTEPSIQISTGDIFSINVPSESLGCYLSLGVVEHFENGPVEALREARRTLHPDGVALISVPYLNSIRSKRLSRGLYSVELPDSAKFHQYYFSFDSFSEHLKEASMEVIDVFPYGTRGFLVAEHPGFSAAWNAPFLPWRAKKLLDKVIDATPKNFRLRYSHMALFVARPI